ncbi:XRE family transcriptional regulator [Bacillus paralicheniformis]|uniref:helix-turn-helix domain-containing protein n=1 Tax=Bacillus paralicheniformis TaxID=1648923 RepID=UPI000D03E846|nr:XRE family transcriptional regulator [Bacillus paralicheniformis]
MEDSKIYLHCNLKKYLDKVGLSANAFAKLIEERRSTINDLINNKDMDTRRIPARLIAKICHELDITPSELFEVRNNQEE